MRTYDLSPLFRSTVGFDRMGRLLDAAFNADEQSWSYPPYNIEKLGNDDYRITMAVAGFTMDDLGVTQHENTLIIKGKSRTEDADARYLHRGIAARAFERRFDLAEHVDVTGARLENGLLVVALKRDVPEAKRPRSIEIATGGPATIEAKKAA